MQEEEIDCGLRNGLLLGKSNFRAVRIYNTVL